MAPEQMGVPQGAPPTPRTFVVTSQGRTVVVRLPPIGSSANSGAPHASNPKSAGGRPHSPKGERGSAELGHADGIKISRTRASVGDGEGEALPSINRCFSSSCQPPNRHARIASLFRRGGQLAANKSEMHDRRVEASAPAPALQPMPPRTPIGLGAKDAPTLNTTKTARPSMLSVVAAQLGWREDRSADLFDKQLPRAHVVWVVSQEELNSVLSSPMRRENTRVSRIPGMHELCRKASFARLLRHSGDGTTAETNSRAALRTWILPDERPPPAAFDRGPIIVKPDDGSQGTGISIVTTPVELDLIAQKIARRGDIAVAQEYVDRPLLVNGYKFDLRLYVLVLSLSPLRVFLCNEGLARVCSEPYFEPTDSATREERLLKNRLTRHLTNYGVSKHNDAFFDDSDEPNDGSRGTKRTLSATLAYLKAQGDISQDVWGDICGLVRKTTLELARACRDERPEPELRLARLWDSSPPKSIGAWPCRAGAWNPHKLGDRERRDCFQLLGMDIMLDEQGTPHVLEANCCPSFNFDKVDVAGSKAKGCYPGTHEDAREDSAGETDSVAGFPLDLLSSRLRGCGTKVCRCSAMVKPHIHRPSKVDLVVKGQALRGLCEIVTRDIRARTAVGQADGTSDAGGTAASSDANTTLWSMAAQCQPSPAPISLDDGVPTTRWEAERAQEQAESSVAPSHMARLAAQLVDGTSYSVMWAGDEDEVKESVPLPRTPPPVQNEQEPAAGRASEQPSTPPARPAQATDAAATQAVIATEISALPSWQAAYHGDLSKRPVSALSAFSKIPADKARPASAEAQFLQL